MILYEKVRYRDRSMMIRLRYPGISGYVGGRAPIVLDHVKVGVAYPTINNFEPYVLLSYCPANIPNHFI